MIMTEISSGLDSKSRPMRTITYLFLASYGVTVITLLLSMIDSVPLREVLGDVKWIYLLFSIVNVFLHARRFNKNILICAGILLAYILMFGLLFVNDIVKGETHQYLIEMLIYFGLLFLTYLQVRRFSCFIAFIKSTYIALSVSLLFAYFTHFSESTLNPFYFIKVIIFDLRRRSTFGFIQQNFTGSICFLTFSISIVYLYYVFKTKGIKTLDPFTAYMIVADAVIWMMFQSTSSRASLTAFFLLLFCVFFFSFIVKRKKLLISSIVFLTVIGTAIFIIAGDEIWSASNRSANITENIKWVEVIGNKWIGMGFVENSAFQYHWVDGVGSSAFGVRTSSLDMYYVYLYCTTGIIGCLMIGSILIYMAILMYKRRKEPFAPIMISIYICMLYYAVWESVIFTFRFWPFFIVFVILWCFIDGTAQKSMNIINKI